MLRVLVSVIFTIILTVATFRAVFIFKLQPPTKSCIDTQGHRRLELTEDRFNRFKGALNIPTISYEAGRYEIQQLIRLIDYIQISFPLVHNSEFVKRERISNYTLLYTITGTDKQLLPYLLTSHLDVVPTVDEKWSTDPFKAQVRDGFIYARGTIDAKHLLMSMLEAFEEMLKHGFRPRRSFYFVFGHDEELGGVEGAQTIAKILPSRLKANNWHKLEYVLDEGNIISRDPIPGVDGQIALVGVVEKGYVTIKISTVGSVGHGSMPPYQTAISKLSKAVGKFHSHLLPSKFGLGVEREMIDIFAAHARWPYKFAYANFWLFKPIFEYVFSSDPTLNALIRTSTAVTIIKGGTKENVLPDSATAYINHRVHQLQSIAEVLEFDRRIVDDPTMSVEVAGHHAEPTPTAPYCDECDAFQLIKQSVLQVYPKAIVVPSVFLAASDSKWYINMTDSIYRFSAISVPLNEMKRFHGHDERISLENYENLLNFFHHLILNSNSDNLASLRPEQGRTEL